ncbi:hypothetical protein C8J56DRAFT_35475 [Mycena floridula]|nr:hypothetical protein C8J56DRAFT_35475 [Mycena floridula]
MSDLRNKSTRLITILCHRCHSEINTAERVDMKQLRAGHYVPLAVEHGQILSKYLVDAERDIMLYDQEINRVSAILGSLQSQRQERQNDALTFKAALSPIRRVPMELWKDIFMQCLDGSPEDIHLTKVCSWWKQMLCFFPEIWSKIIVDLSLSSWETVSASFDTHRVFSKDTPLHLDIRFPLQRPNEDKGSNEWWTDDAPGKHIPAALDKVFSKTKYVMTQLTVTALDDSEFGANYLHEVWGKIPLPACLESVKINFVLGEAEYHSTYDRTLYQHLWKCHKLRHLDFSDPMFDYEDWDPDLVKFWGSLETVRLGVLLIHHPRLHLPGIQTLFDDHRRCIHAFGGRCGIIQPAKFLCSWRF